jgi:ribosomal protein S20
MKFKKLKKHLEKVHTALVLTDKPYNCSKTEIWFNSREDVDKVMFYTYDSNYKSSFVDFVNMKGDCTSEIYQKIISKNERSKLQNTYLNSYIKNKIKNILLELEDNINYLKNHEKLDWDIKYSQRLAFYYHEKKILEECFKHLDFLIKIK